MQNAVPAHGAFRSWRKKATVASVADGPMTGAHVHMYQSPAQIQLLRPTFDETAGKAGAWLTSPTGGMLVDRIKEAVPSDAEFIFIGGAPTGQTTMFGFSSATDPAVSTGHYFRWRYRIPSTTGAWSITAYLTSTAVSITSITRVGTTATVTTGAAHGLTTGETAYILPISGLTNAYAGAFTVTVTDGTHFTYTISGSPATPATGTLFSVRVYAADAASGTGTTAFVQRERLLNAAETDMINTYAGLRMIIAATVAGAAQVVRPTSDVTVGSWLTQAGGSANLYQAIDETPASDTDYVKSPNLLLGGAIYTYVSGFGTAVDPLSTASHILRYRARGVNTGVQLKARLRQGSTLIKETVRTNISTAFTDYADTLSTGESDLITDYSALRLEVEVGYPSVAVATEFTVALPISDVAIGIGVAVWETSTGTGTWASMLDESSPSDADFIFKLNSGSSNIQGVKFDALTAPTTRKDHSVHIRAKSPLPGSKNLDVSLIRASDGVAYKTWSAIALTSSFSELTLTLTEGEANLIESYSDLGVAFDAYGPDEGEEVSISWVALYVPAERAGQVSFSELEVPSSARAEVSWVEAETPALVQFYQGDVSTFFAGSKTLLYTFGTAGFTDISRVGNYGAGALPAGWRFCSFGNNIVATNKADAVQYRADNAGDFLDAITAPSPAPKARFCATVRNQLALADINLTAFDSDWIWLSAIDNLRDFTISPVTASFAAKIVSCPGQLMGVVGGDSGVFFKRRSMHLLSWTGSQGLPYRQDVISPAIGTPFPSSIVQTPYGIFFFDGMTFRRYLLGAGDPQDIGTGILSAFMTDADFFTEALAPVDPADLAAEDQQMVGYWDAAAQVVLWVYQAVNGTASRHSRGVIYSPSQDRWGTLYDATLNAAYVVGRANPAGSLKHLLKGAVGLDWNGTATAWFRWDGEQTYSATFQSKRQSLGIAETDGKPVASRIRGLIPIFAHRPEGSTIPAALSVQVDASNEPAFLAGYRTKTATQAQASTQGVLPCDITGFWFRFFVSIPELTAQEMLAFRGLFVIWDQAGSPGSA